MRFHLIIYWVLCFGPLVTQFEVCGRTKLVNVSEREEKNWVPNTHPKLLPSNWDSAVVHLLRFSLHSTQEYQGYSKREFITNYGYQRLLKCVTTSYLIQHHLFDSYLANKNINLDKIGNWENQCYLSNHLLENVCTFLWVMHSCTKSLIANYYHKHNTQSPIFFWKYLT